MQTTMSAILLFGCLAASSASASVCTFVGQDADSMLSALLSVDAPTRPGSGNTNDVTTAEALTCGPLNQGASCDVRLDGTTTRTIERAFGLTKRLADCGAETSVVDGRMAYQATKIFCRKYRTGSPLTKCSLEPAQSGSL